MFYFYWGALFFLFLGNNWFSYTNEVVIKFSSYLLFLFPVSVFESLERYC